MKNYYLSSYEFDMMNDEELDNWEKEKEAMEEDYGYCK